MNSQQTYKSPAQFTKGEKQPPKNPQGFSKKGNGGMDAKNQMAKRSKKKKEHEKGKHYKKAEKMCAKCKEAHKTSEHKEKKHKGAMKMTPVSKGHKPKGAHGRAAVKALGRTKTTGNFKKIEESKGKGAAIAAYQNKLRAHQSHMKRKAAEKKMTGKELLGKAMKRLKH